MARLRDWVNLGKNTIGSLTTDDVTGLYIREWPETKRVLIAEYEESIGREPKRVNRFVRTISAVLYGLAKRLAPHRRILFVLAFLLFFVSLFALMTRMEEPPLLIFVEIAATFLIVTVLLAMELIDKLRFRDELELARDLQADLIPKRPPQTDSYSIGAFNHIANTVGGDIYDFVVLPDGRLAVLFGDASGHGMAAGLVMAVAHAAFRTQIDIDPTSEVVVACLNRILCRTGGPRSFFAACYVLLSPDGSFTATVAGHPPILKIDREGRIAARIGEGSYPLGIKTTLQWSPTCGCLLPGERLLFHSDGLSETRNAAGNEFGDAYIEAIASWHPELAAGGLVDSIIAEWQTFRGRTPAEDDVTVAVVAKR